MEKILCKIYNSARWFYGLKWIDRLNKPTYFEHNVYDSYGIIDTLGYHGYKGRWSYSYSEELGSSSKYKLLPGLWICADECGYSTNIPTSYREMRFKWLRMYYKAAVGTCLWIQGKTRANSRFNRLIINLYVNNKTKQVKLRG